MPRRIKDWLSQKWRVRVGSRKGFTLLEVMMAALVLSIALLALSSMQNMATGSNYSSHRWTAATILAQDKMEELKGLVWTDARIADNTGLASYTDFSSGGIPQPIDINGTQLPFGSAAGYTRTWNVTDNSPGQYMKTISINVAWSDKAAHTINLSTIISQE